MASLANFAADPFFAHSTLQQEPSPLSDWFDSLAEFEPVAVLVLGPDSVAANDQREVVAVYPPDYDREASTLANSSAFGVGWRSSAAPLVAWKSFAAEQGDDHWVSAWVERGALSMVRVDFPTAFGQGFECFMFCGRPFRDADDPKRVAYTAMSVWPLIKANVVSRRYDITAREMEVLAALAEGLSVKEACDRLRIADRTIGFHQSNLQEKLRASNRAAVVQRACVLGLL